MNPIGEGPAKPPPAEVRSLFRSFDVEMSDAEFCHSPLGQFEGDTDRYVAGMMFGCIPVMLTRTVFGQNGGPVRLAQPLEEHPDIDWAAISVQVTLEDLQQRLPAILAAVTPKQRLGMRKALAGVWPRFLYSGMYGSYLGEDASADAFESFVDILRLRVEAMPPLPGVGWVR